MGEQLKHRGPDDSGTWVDEDAGVGLAHTRLAIIDLSRNGAQPMRSSSGRYVISYNGEMYNFLEIKGQLLKLGVTFRGNSDTEVVLEAIQMWGTAEALRKFVGMFAFALWDRQERQLILARDRMGEKPLYYGVSGGTFLFGSELKALKMHPEWQGEVDRDALSLFFRHNYIPEPFSIYKGIAKLNPGHFIRLSDSPHTSSKEIFGQGSAKWFMSKECYWSLQQAFMNNIETKLSNTELVDRLDELLHASIKGQMISDVPLGALLSGGIDSSAVTAVMQAESKQPIKTFSIGFEEAAFNEAKYAAAVARHLGTDHTELYVTPAETREVIPRLPDLYDEPFADSSQIPTWLVSKLVRQEVTVCLSGDGGDELFAGYDRYAWTKKIWKSIRWMPKSVRHLASKVLTTIPRSAWNVALLPMRAYFARHGAVGDLGHKAHRLADTLDIDHRVHLYKLLISHWGSPESIVINGSEPQTLLDCCPHNPDRTFVEQMMYIDMLTYLPGDILTKVDRASMGTSLEVRVPFLDHRIVEFSWQVPMAAKVNEDKNKWLLRQVLSRYVPETLIDRPKMGFAVPVGQWLRGPLRNWAEDLLSVSELTKHDYLKVDPIRKKWSEHINGQRDWQYHLWDVLMFQSWLRSAG